MITSNAQWPKGTIAGGNDITSDEHLTVGAANAACERLERKGFGGEGKIFPLNTWVEVPYPTYLFTKEKLDVGF